MITRSDQEADRRITLALRMLTLDQTLAAEAGILPDRRSILEGFTLAQLNQVEEFLRSFLTARLYGGT